MLDLLTPLLREARGEALAQALAVPPALRLGAPPLPVGGGVLVAQGLAVGDRVAGSEAV